MGFSQSQTGTLKRTLGFWALVAYGVGDILGAGIYALIGKVAGIAGIACWISFAVAMGVAALTALSYAELSSRFPKSGGEATFTQEIFRRPGLSLLIGWLVLCSGIVSMATISRAFAGYLQGILSILPQWIIILVFLVILTSINFRGMRESSLSNIICTVIELTGLLIVIVAACSLLGGHVEISALPGAGEPTSWNAILKGSALAFFAFIGFEDMVNVAEEVVTPERVLPKAILTAVALAGILYMLIAWLAVSVVPTAELANSSAPLLEVVRRSHLGIPVALFTVIALFAVSNTALLNFVMGSRLIYGMASQRLLPAWLGVVHPVRRTPHRAIFAILVISAVLALSGTLVFLAGTTSFLLLSVFFTANLGLIVIKRRKESHHVGFRVPIAVPIAGALASLGLMVFVPRQVMGASLIILLFGIGIVGLRAVMQRRV